jgi:8-hydroxy-5-deazaflavin:NADPH oxidoreductase
MTTIALLGTGRMATTLARIWLDKGHTLVLGSRNPEVARGRLGALGEQVRVTDFADACAGKDVIVVAVPFHAVAEVVAACGDLTGKIVIDTTNPWTPGTDRLAVGPETSAAEEIARIAKGAHVIKAMNGIFWKNLRDPVANGTKLSMFYCGDDDSSKSTFAELALQLGFDPIDCGPLPRARILESIALLWARLAFEQGMGTDIAITLVRR